MRNLIYKYSKYIILASLLYIPIFGYLNTLPIREWDEARLSINAYEMLKKGDLIVTHYEGKPDMWNTKPPMMIWLQVICMKILGVNELAVRLSSALAAFFTALMLLLVSQRYLKSFWFGFIVIAVLFTSHGYVSCHSIRTGDYDALLTLFTTLSGMLFFFFIETKQNKFLYLFFLCNAFAVLTKSIEGLMFIPAIVLYSVFKKQIIVIFKNRHFYLGILLFMILVIGYYFLRESQNPGYIRAVENNELGGRYFGVIENHKQDFWFYYNNLIHYRFNFWYLLVPCGIALGLLSKNNKLKSLVLFSSIMVVTFCLIISISETKLEWYDVPLYPFLSIIVAVFIYNVFRYLASLEWLNKTLTINALPYIFLFLIFIKPYQTIINATFLPREYDWDKSFYEIGYYLKDAVKGKYNLNHQYLLFDGYNAQNLFYLNILNDMGEKISFKDWKKLGNKDEVIASQNNVKHYIEKHYLYTIMAKTGNVTTYEIEGDK